jgi:hypothetical protein
MLLCAKLFHRQEVLNFFEKGAAVFLAPFIMDKDPAAFAGHLFSSIWPIFSFGLP